MAHRIASIEADPAHFRLVLHWKSGVITLKDMRRAIGRRSIFAELRDARVFGRARIVDGGYAIGWPGTDVELAADALWYEAHPREMPFPNEVMTAGDFKDWMQAQGLSLSTTAEALGLSRRSIAYYAGGTRRIPRVVFLACMALAGARRSIPSAA